MGRVENEEEVELPRRIYFKNMVEIDLKYQLIHFGIAKYYYQFKKNKLNDKQNDKQRSTITLMGKCR